MAGRTPSGENRSCKVKWKAKKPPLHGDQRTRFKFAWFPVRVFSSWLWLEWYGVSEIYKDAAWNEMYGGWHFRHRFFVDSNSDDKWDILKYWSILFPVCLVSNALLCAFLWNRPFDSYDFIWNVVLSFFIAVWNCKPDRKVVVA